MLTSNKWLIVEKVLNFLTQVCNVKIQLQELNCLSKPKIYAVQHQELVQDLEDSTYIRQNNINTFLN